MPLDAQDLLEFPIGDVGGVEPDAAIVQLVYERICFDFFCIIIYNHYRFLCLIEG